MVTRTTQIFSEDILFFAAVTGNGLSVKDELRGQEGETLQGTPDKSYHGVPDNINDMSNALFLTGFEVLDTF